MIHWMLFYLFYSISQVEFRAYRWAENQFPFSRFFKDENRRFALAVCFFVRGLALERLKYLSPSLMKVGDFSLQLKAKELNDNDASNKAHVSSIQKFFNNIVLP